MMAWNQSGIRSRLASTLEPICRTEFADNDRRSLQPHARNRIQQRTLVVQIGTVPDVLFDFLFESINLLSNLFEQIFLCFSNRRIFSLVEAIFRSGLLLFQRLAGPGQLLKAALSGRGRLPGPRLFSCAEASNQRCIGRIGLTSSELAVGISLQPSRVDPAHSVARFVKAGGDGLFVSPAGLHTHAGGFRNRSPLNRSPLVEPVQ